MTFQVTPKTLRNWCSRYLREGETGLEVKNGRGRPRRADPEEIADYALQSPRNFGIDRTHWLLDLLTQVVPSLKGFSRYGAQQALRRSGFSYKRGKPSLHSPDPEYAEKKDLEQTLSESRDNPRKVVLIFQDECSFYRQPSTAWLWRWMGRMQPKMKYASKNNTRMRIVGYLNATTGTLHSSDMKSVISKCLTKNISTISSWYPQTEKIYAVWDNWPNHRSKDVVTALENHKRVVPLYMPTYSPWLKAIEKVWKRVRQNVSHAHPCCDNFHEFRKQIHAEQDLKKAESHELIRYVGLSV